MPARERLWSRGCAEFWAGLGTNWVDGLFARVGIILGRTEDNMVENSLIRDGIKKSMGTTAHKTQEVGENQ